MDYDSVDLVISNGVINLVPDKSLTELQIVIAKALHARQCLLLRLNRHVHADNMARGVHLDPGY